MFDYDSSRVARDILKSLTEPRDYDVSLVPVKLTVVQGNIFVTANQGIANEVSAQFGVGFENRQALYVGERYFLLDALTPELSASAFKLPETQEAVKKRALNKLSKEERAALGL